MVLTTFDRCLAEAVHSAFPLFKPVRVPRQVVMDAGVKIALKIDAFTQTIRRNQNAAFFFSYFRHFGLPLIVAYHAVNRYDSNIVKFPCERALQSFGDIIRCGDIATPNDWMKALDARDR